MSVNIPNNEPETFVNNSLNNSVDSEPIISAINNAKEEIIDRLTKEIEKMNISKEENIPQEELEVVEESNNEETQLSKNTDTKEVVEDSEEEANTFDVPEIPNFTPEEEIPQPETTVNSEIVNQVSEEQTVDAPVEAVSVPEQVMQNKVPAPIVDQNKVEEPIENNEFSPVSVSTIESPFVPIDEIIGSAEEEPATIPMSAVDQQVAPANNAQPVVPEAAPVETAPVQNVTPVEPSPAVAIEPVITPDVVAQPVAVEPVQNVAPVEPSPAVAVEPVITPDVVAQPVAVAPVQNVAPVEPSPAPKVTIVTRLYPISEVKTEGQHRVEKVAPGVNENIAKLGEQKTLVNSITA